MSNPIEDLKASFDKLQSMPKVPVGIVFPEGLRGAITRHFQSGSNTSSNKDSFGIPWGIPIFFDPHQFEECVTFYDEKLLRLYLNRREDEEAWARALVDILMRKEKIKVE